MVQGNLKLVAAWQLFRKYCKQEFNAELPSWIDRSKLLQSGPFGRWYLFKSPDGCYEVTVYADGVVKRRERDYLDDREEEET